MAKEDACFVGKEKIGDKKNNRKKFLYKKSYLDRRLNQDVMENGIAYIPCRVLGIDDIISRFSVEGCESVDSEFMNFITEFVDYVPPEYPVVLEIEGAKFSLAEKKIITDTILSEAAYQHGKMEEMIAYKRKIFWSMMIGTVVSGVLLGIAKKFISDVPLELFYVIFWLFADAIVRYLFIEYPDFKELKIHTGRLASMKIEFKEENEIKESTS